MEQNYNIDMIVLLDTGRLMRINQKGDQTVFYNSLFDHINNIQAEHLLRKADMRLRLYFEHMGVARPEFKYDNYYGNKL